MNPARGNSSPCLTRYQPSVIVRRQQSPRVEMSAVWEDDRDRGPRGQTQFHAVDSLPAAGGTTLSIITPDSYTEAQLPLRGSPKL